MTLTTGYKTHIIIPKGDTIEVADKVRTYWSERGYDIGVHVVNLTPHSVYPIWSIKSDTLNGWPISLAHKLLSSPAAGV